MPRHHMIDNVKVPFTPEEETARDLEEAQWHTDKPMKDWKHEIAGTDAGMPRIWEDFLTLNGTDGWPQVTKDRHISKVALRATQPEA